MKNLLFICGPNGIGKTTICREMLRLLPNSAYVDSDPLRLMNPFVLDDDTIPTIRKNIADIIRNYLGCPAAQTVIFSYGFHGRRREVFAGVMNDLSGLEYRFIPFLLTCNEAENIRRMACDGRDAERIARALQTSRGAYAELDYPRVDVSALSAHEAAQRLLAEAGLRDLPPPSAHVAPAPPISI